MLDMLGMTRPRQYTQRNSSSSTPRPYQTTCAAAWIRSITPAFSTQAMVHCDMLQNAAVGAPTDFQPLPLQSRSRNPSRDIAPRTFRGREHGDAPRPAERPPISRSLDLDATLHYSAASVAAVRGQTPTRNVTCSTEGELGLRGNCHVCSKRWPCRTESLKNTASADRIRLLACQRRKTVVLCSPALDLSYSAETACSKCSTARIDHSPYRGTSDHCLAATGCLNATSSPNHQSPPYSAILKQTTHAAPTCCLDG